MVDTVKPAEDGDGLIVRLYEAHGGRGVARLRVGVPFAEAWFANLLEDRLGPAEVEGAWRWVADDEVHWRPRQYWPSGTSVRGLPV